MKKIAIIAVAIAAIASAASVSAQEATQKPGCNTCHALDKKKMGPSYQDIAKKFKGQANAEKDLLAKLTAGKGHPAVKAPVPEVESALKWILSQ
ncbi:MAG: cytochrome C [Burkholderiaceae bacterium]